ncbi:MAG: HNH endonuclease signature motif containing protein [Mycobacterium sp.]
MPTPLLAELLRNGAKLRPLCPPEKDAEPEPGYRPSAKLDRFVRARDLTCRFPGCTMPAEFCDIDHVIPYPLGATHPSNLACLCRKHHHLKTF